MAAASSLRDSPRLRAGLALIAAIVAGHGLLEWQAALERQAVEVRQLGAQVVRMKRQEGQQHWAPRAAQAAQALEAAKAELWRDGSTGKAQAQVQDWLASLLRQIDAKGASVRVADGDAALEASSSGASALPPGLVPVRARVEINTDPAVLLALLAEVNESAQRIVVDRLSVKPVKTELGLVFWFRIASAAEPGAPTPERRP